MSAGAPDAPCVHAAIVQCEQNADGGNGASLFLHPSQQARGHAGEEEKKLPEFLDGKSSLFHEADSKLASIGASRWPPRASA